MPPKPRLVGELAFAVVMLLLSFAVGYLAYQISGFSSINSAGAFPLGVSLIMLVSSLWCVVEALARRAPEERGFAAIRKFCKDHFPPQVLGFVAMAVGYLVSMTWVSFYISTFVFLVASILYLRRGGIALSLAVSALAILMVYLLFTLVFSVYLP
ncbi:tripartite tricarboxylate transporter TctB family protein [Stutzerimonas tarimensis]|uniref:Tripartite tricarboxylate transporter TctB family protein n=1 Tax=Stutzerimonas tarimensis TaxID=1507735 RepID=A0ABV7T6K0_9GAMM